MSIVRGVLMIKCDSCQRQHDFHPDNTAFSSLYTKKRGEGEETAYAWDSEVQCDCGNNIAIDYKVWEFPAGDFNFDELKVRGASVVAKFDYDFEREPDFYE